MLDRAKQLYNKVDAGYQLTNEEVIEGELLFRELARDYTEAYGDQLLAFEFRQFHEFLVKTKTERNL